MMPLHESPRLIKARSNGVRDTARPFNFDDLRRQCDDYVALARDERNQLLAQAAAQADELRRQAFAEGLAAGRREALARAHELIEARAQELATGQVETAVKSALPALAGAAQALRNERDGWLAAWEQAALSLSAAIAEKILRHELSRRPELGIEMIREALQLAAGTTHFTLRLSPLDLQWIRSSQSDILARLSAVGQAQLVADESLAPGGCVIETRHGVIDARLETQLARIAQELSDAA